MAQQRYRRKLKAKENDTKSSKWFSYTLAKAVKKVIRVLPNDKDKRYAIVRRIGQDLGVLEKSKTKRMQVQISDSTIEEVQNFYNNDTISCQAPGKRDFVTVRENGIRVKRQKRYLLYNIREVYQLFVEEYSSMGRFLLEEILYIRICMQIFSVKTNS